MERCTSCQNLIFKDKSYWKLLMGVTENVKSGWGKFSLQHSTTTFRVKAGELQKNKCNTQRKPGYLKVQERQDPEGRKGGTLRLIKIVKKELS